MREIINRLEDVIVQPAINQNEFELEIKADPDNIDSQPLLTFNSLDFAYGEATRINNLITEKGINEGLKYSMSIKEGGSELEILDGLLIPSGAEAVYSCEMIEGLRVERRRDVDSLSKQAKQITFAQLLEDGFFTTDEYIQVPYVLNSIPDYKGAAIIGITAFIVLDKLVVMVKELFKVIADIGGVLSALAGVLKIVVLVVWIIITLATLIIFMFQILDQLIQPVKYHAGMLWKRQLEIGCEALGYTFESSIFDDSFIADTVLLPAKFSVVDDDPNKISLGFLTPNKTETTGYYAGSFFELLQDTKTTFRAYVKITTDNRLIIERIGDSTNDPAFNMNPLIKMDEWTTNAQEIIGNYEIRFLQDGASDNNTAKDYEGTVTNAVTTRKKGDNPTVDGHKVVRIPFARASRKPDLTRIEEIASVFLESHLEPINEVVKAVNLAIILRNLNIPKIRLVVKRLAVVGINVPFNPLPIPPMPPIESGEIETRIGMMAIENDYFTVPKVLSLDINSDPKRTNVKTDNNTKWHSGHLYETYHKGQSHVPSTEFPYGNQKRGYEALEPNVCKEDLILIINNPSIFAPNGQNAEYTSFRHNIHTANSSISYRVPYVSDDFLEIDVKTRTGK